MFFFFIYIQNLYIYKFCLGQHYTNAQHSCFWRVHICAPKDHTKLDIQAHLQNERWTAVNTEPFVLFSQERRSLGQCYSKCGSRTGAGHKLLVIGLRQDVCKIESV